jgi:hypothetical protein
VNDKKASILAEAAEIAMDGWHSVEKAKAFACSVSDYLLALTSAPAEPLRKLAAYPLEDFGLIAAADGKPLFGACDWKLTVGDVRAARAELANAPAETPPAAGAIDARGQESEIPTDGLGLEWVHSVLRWAAAGYVHTPERMRFLRGAYRIVDRLVNATPEEAPAAAGAALAVANEVVTALRIHHEWSIRHMPGYSDDGDERVAYRATVAALAAPPAPEPMRTHVERFATAAGWAKSSSEGAFEFVQRISYRQGWDDCKREAKDPNREITAAEPVISAEDSLRTRLRWSQEKVEQLEQENRTLRGRLPGPNLDDLLKAAQPIEREDGK